MAVKKKKVVQNVSAFEAAKRLKAAKARKAKMLKEAGNTKKKK